MLRSGIGQPGKRGFKPGILKQAMLSGNRSTSTFVVDRPIDLPGLTAVAGRFPTPVEAVASNIFPDHALQNFSPVGTDAFALQDHLSIFELADKIQISAFIIDPSLFPFSGSSVEGGEAGTAQVHRIRAGEVLLHDATVEHSLDGVCAVAGLGVVLSRPGKVPFTNPKVELLLLWSGTGIRLCAGC